MNAEQKKKEDNDWTDEEDDEESPSQVPHRNLHRSYSEPRMNKGKATLKKRTVECWDKAEEVVSKKKKVIQPTSEDDLED